jgi:hypothetical protein
MRSVLAVVASALLAMPVLAADRTLLDDEDVWKLYTSIDFKYMELNDTSAPFVGLGIGGILNDTLDIGVAGYGLAHDIKITDNPEIDVRALDHWAAGLNVGYTFMPSALLHLRVGLFAGYSELHTHPDFGPEDSGSFAVIEPSAMAFINVSETVEVGAGVGYRYVENSNLESVSDDDLSDITLNAAIRVTEF